jgi:cyanate permease
LLGCGGVVLLAPFSNYFLIGGAILIVFGITIKNVVFLRKMRGQKETG